MQRVFVLEKNREPLMPCHPARAWKLLRQGRAAVFRHAPFTIILTNREDGELQPLQVKIDPGSRTTGIAVVQENKRGNQVVWSGELHHRGTQVKSDMDNRHALRRSRRSRKTRYRQSRFNNRCRREGWLPPSPQSRPDNIVSWLDRLYRWTPLTGISMELARFDTQQMENLEINGVEYQQGTLYGYEVREYLLEKWERKCACCGVKDVPLEVEHNLTAARFGNFDIRTATGRVQGINHRYCTPLHKSDGYLYEKGVALSSTAVKTV